MADPMQGPIELSKAYRWVLRERIGLQGLAPNTKELQELRRICQGIMSSVTESAGVYVWGYFDSLNRWQSVYVGQAGAQQGLKRRLTRQLLGSGRGLFWRILHTEQAILYTLEELYPHQRHRYRRRWSSYLSRYPADLILWKGFSSIDGSALNEVEAVLIESLSPKANDVRPIPMGTASSFASEAWQTIQELISSQRPGLRQQLDEEEDE